MSPRPTTDQSRRLVAGIAGDDRIGPTVTIVELLARRRALIEFPSGSRLIVPDSMLRPR